MGPAERRQELLEVLCHRRHDTYDNLARDFNVSKMTIRRDIAALMCSYPIETVHGGRHGCVKVMDRYYLHHRNRDHKALDTKQIRPTFPPTRPPCGSPGSSWANTTASSAETDSRADLHHFS